MEQERPSFLELEGNQVRICCNLRVNVLEKADILLGKFNQTEMLPTKPTKLMKDSKLFIKPKVFLNPLSKRWTKVGSFYNINDLDHADKLFKTHESVKVDDDPKHQVNEDVAKVCKRSVAEDRKDLSSSDMLGIKDLLSDSEKRLRDKKMKITSLKINLANMEKKNAEKKLSIQKRDRRIKELEGTIKIKDDAYKRFKELHRSHSKDNMKNCQDSLEDEILGLEMELSKKNATINRLEEENTSLRKFKSWSRSLEKELASLKKNLNSRDRSKEKNSILAEKDSKKKSATTNIFEDEVEIEEVPCVAEKEQTDSSDETIESISSFLAELTDESVDLEENVSSRKISSEKTTNPIQRMDPSQTKGKAASKPTARLALTKTTRSTDVSSAAAAFDDASPMKQKTIQDCFVANDNAISVKYDSKNDTITSLSSVDEIDLTCDGEDILLESMLEDHPTFSKEDESIMIQEETVRSFLSFKPFASLCAKSDNIVEFQKRRQVEEFCEIPSKRHKLDEFLRRAMEL